MQAGDRLHEMKPNEKVATFAGILTGLLLTLMLSYCFPLKGVWGVWLTIVIGIVLIYLGIVASWSMKDEMRFFLPGSANLAPDGKEAVPEQCKILDTNVIIDGRVADICRTGFIEGPIYVPGFVLDELQHIADSADSLKRARGRRGLDILNQMRTELKMMIRTYDNNDPGDRDEVDAKLVKLAKKLNGKIVTNDYNLNKVAELQGVAGSEHQRTGERRQARGPARRRDAGDDHQRRQRTEPGRGLFRRRHHDCRGRRAAAHRRDAPGGHQQRFADSRRQDDLRQHSRRGRGRRRL